MRIKKFAVLTVTLLMLVILTACSAISEGYITDKAFTPAHDTHSIMCYSIKPLICIPTTVHHPDSWSFGIEKGEETGWVYVTEEEYNSYEVGDYYPA